MKNPFNPSEKKVKTLKAEDSWPEAKHRFEAESVKAVRAALAAGRPLLLLGEPGSGRASWLGRWPPNWRSLFSIW